MKKNLINLIMVLFAFSGIIHAQNQFTATWALSSTARKTPVISGAVTADSQNVSRAYTIRDYSGTSSSQRVYFTGSVLGYWPNSTTKIDSCYTEFTVYPAAGVSLNITEISMSIGNSGGSSALRASIFYSTDNFISMVPVQENITLPSSALNAQVNAVNVNLPISGKISVRVYPWLNGGVASGKYFNIQNVVIKGTSSGTPIVSLPIISTTAVAGISTTSAVTGGNVTADGGGTVTARGVCWNTTGSPTTADAKTADGTGTGLFTSSLSGLAISTKYYVRAYATNSAGTAYGAEVSFTTLAALSVPTVTTNSITGILTTSAVSGGNVTFDGGLAVTERGVCYSTNPAPSITGLKTSDGGGTGSFTSYIYNLSINTTYYVRAYATNSQGTGYGAEISFTTAVPMPDIRKVVASDGSGDYTTVQAAFDAVPDNYTGKWTIYVKTGTYKEKLLLDSKKINVILEGQNRENTILTYDDYSGRVVNGVTLTTSTTYSVAIDASDFLAKNITFQNTSQAAQAVALRTNGDRQIYENCKMLGYQDTYYLWGGSAPGRIYNHNCYIEGSVDFIFGRNIALFEGCTININRNAGTLTAASTEATCTYGLVFKNCTITVSPIGFDGAPVTSFYLGRPWQASPRTVFINCTEPAELNPAGWLSWNVTPSLYAEYNCTGSGSAFSGRVAWSKQLTSAEAALYTITNIFAKASGAGAYDWNPYLIVSNEKSFTSNEIPVTPQLMQNYPNPFNPETVITYSLPERTHVRLKVYDITGREIATIVNDEQSAGTHKVRFSSADMNLSSGVYLYGINSGRFSSMKKMIILK
jgi:pectinesterase